MFAGIFAAMSVYSSYRGTDILGVYGWLVGGILVGLVAIASPFLLTPFNKAWMRLGELMGKVVSPFVLGVIFFALITPIALITRFFSRDELRLKRTNGDSYWINRTPPGPSKDSFKKQF